MLIIVPKSFSGQVYRPFSTIFAIINIIIVIITGISHAIMWSWLQDDASNLHFSNPGGGKYSMVLSPRFRSKLFNGILLVFSIRPQQSHCRQQSFPLIILWEKL